MSNKPDHEASMAKSELIQIAKNAMSIYKMIQDGDNLEGWISSYITISNDHLNSVQERMEGQTVNGVAEAYGRRDAYQRDYDHSVAGMGKRQSYAYSQDGGANDEGEVDSYTPPKKQIPAKGYYFYNVPAGQESEAEKAGLFKTKSGKWFSPFENQKASMFFGKGKFWSPKNESIEENKKGVRATKQTTKPRNFVAKNAVQSGAGSHKDKKKAAKQGDTKHKSNAYENALHQALEQSLQVMEGYSRYWCSTDKKWKERKGPKQSRK